jgi:nicotinamidase-related amidase
MLIMTNDTPPAGSTPPAVARDAALLVIDVQAGFDDTGFWGRRNNPGAEDHIRALLDAWAATDRPIVLARHDSAGPTPLHPDNPGNRFKEVLAGVEPALLVVKNVNSVFYGTPDLHAWLRERGIRQLVIAGIQTNMCNETTARMAGNLGYDVLFVEDAMHTFDLTGPDGGLVTAEELTRATVASLHGGRFARVLRTAEVLAGLGGA